MITDTYPTTILQDFRTFLTYIKSKKLKLTRTKQYITRKDLRELDTQLTLNRPNVPAHGNQDDYPIIHLFFLLSLELDLVRKVNDNNQIVLTIHEQRLSSYEILTNSEKYVTLLEIFWTKLEWNMLQRSRYTTAPNNIDFLFNYCEELPIGKILAVKDFPELDNFVEGYEHFLYFFDCFGLWKFEIDEEASYQKERYVTIAAKSIELTVLFKILKDPLIETWEPAGVESDALMGLFNILSNEPSNSIEIDKEENDTSLKTLLIPLFPKGELNHVLSDIDNNDFVTGNYVLKVQLHPKCWRSMQLSSSHTLLDLHHLIQATFDFDDDHLFAFYMDGKRFSNNSYNSRMDLAGPYADEAKIGNLKLYEGQRFLYLFDFSDEWQFNIDVIKIVEGQEDNQTFIIKSVGESPDQYGFY